MSDNEYKTSPLNRMLTTFGVGSARLESDRGESAAFLNDMIHGWKTYFEDTGILRFAREDHWNRHEDRYRDKRLEDSYGNVWAYIDGQWRYLECGDWCSELPIEAYILDGFTIVNDRM